MLTSVSGCQNGAPAKSSPRPSVASPSPLRSGHADVVRVPMTAGTRPHHTRPVKLPAGKAKPHVVHPHTDSATLFNVVIDGTLLVNQPLIIDGTSDLFDSNAPHTEQLAAGTYGLRGYALSDDIGTFTVTDSGTVDYDASLEKIFTGRGSSTLTLLGYSVTIDASALVAQQFFLGYIGYFPNQPAMTFQLAPGGSYQVGLEPQDPGVSGTFSVDTSGNVSYDPSLEGVFTGHGTPTLTINPAKNPVTISTAGMSESIALNYIGYIGPNSSESLMLAAGGYSISVVGSGANLGEFTVAADGTISYSPTLSGVFGGQGTTTLSILAAGKGITITGAQLTDQTLALDNVGYFDSQTPTLFQLSPGGPYTLWLAAEAGTQTIGSFSVTADGNVDYDDSLIGVLAGRGTPTLEVLPAKQHVFIDGGQLSPQDAALNYIGYFDTSTPFEVVLASGDYSIGIPGQGNSPALGIFHVAVDGTISYDAAYDSVFMGAGTNQLTLNAVTITINSGQLPNRFVAVDSVTNWESSSAPFQISVAPGTYSIIEYGEVGITGYFTVSSTGIISYDPAYKGVFQGAGTSTLYLLAVAIGIDATRLTEQQLAIDGVTDAFDTAAVKTIAVAPGEYSLQQAGNDIAAFTVFSDATVDYDASFSGIFSGRGTNTLLVHGQRIVVNTSLQDSGSFTVTPLTQTMDAGGRATQLDLLPDSQLHYTDPNFSFDFTVDSSGLVQFDASLDAQVSGRGTRELLLGQYPRYNDVYGKATHNSYWMNRGDNADIGASGSQELITDQLLHEHVHTLELDLHTEGVDAHNFKVYHTSPSEDFLCRTLSDCLEYLRQVHYVTPQHDVINVILELKNSNGVPDPAPHFFDDTHTIEDLDNIIRNALGDALFTPADFGQGCDSGLSLTGCANAKLHSNPQIPVWPTIDKLRGKFIINVIGNWSTNGIDWANYATTDIWNRAAFPVQSIFDYALPSSFPSGVCPPLETGFENAVSNETVTIEVNGDPNNIVCIRDLSHLDKDGLVGAFAPPMPDLIRQQAFDNSMFWQMEATWEPSALLGWKAFQNNLSGVTRTHDAENFASNCTDLNNCQDTLIANGMQNIQTDYPWYFYNDTFDNGPQPNVWLPQTDPSQRLRTTVRGQYNEPGSRIYFQSFGAPYPGAWVFQDVPALGVRWMEAMGSSTISGIPSGGDTDPENYPPSAYSNGEACIVVRDASELEGYELCRQKNTAGGGSYYQETVDLYMRVYHGGQVAQQYQTRGGMYAPCWSALDKNDDLEMHACIGSMLALSIQNNGFSSEVSALSASVLSGTPSPTTNGLTPQWVSLGFDASFDVPMTKQGYRGWKSEMLTGLRVNDGSGLRDITLADLPNQRGVTQGQALPSALVFDLSY